MSLINEDNSFCPSCGKVVNYVQPSTGWCRSCSQTGSLNPRSKSRKKRTAFDLIQENRNLREQLKHATHELSRKTPQISQEEWMMIMENRGLCR